MLITLAFRPAQAPERLSAALASARATRLALGPLSEAQAAELLEGLDATSVAAVLRHGGVRWLHVDDDTGATELVMDPTNNKVLYAATYQRRRAQWGMNGGGAGSAIARQA